MQTREGLLTRVVGYSVASLGFGCALAYVIVTLLRRMDSMVYPVLAGLLALLALVIFVLIGHHDRAEETIESWPAALWGAVEVAGIVGAVVAAVARWVLRLDAEAVAFVAASVGLVFFVALVAIALKARSTS